MSSTEARWPDDFLDPTAWLRHDGNRWTRIEPDDAEPGDLVIYHEPIDEVPDAEAD